MRILLATLLIACCVACSPADGNHVTGEDMKVLGALVSTACQLEAREIVSDVPAAHGGAHFGLDLSRRIPESARWPDDSLCNTVRVAKDSVIRQALGPATRQPSPWPGFEARFDGAATLLEVSLPVYSPDGRHAVVYTSSTCPYRCGAGFYHELVKGPLGWRIEHSDPAWTS